MLRIALVLALALLAGHARADDVRWGVGYTGSAKALTGPQRSFASYCKACAVGERIAKPPSPYLAVQITKPEPDLHSAHGYDVMMIAIRVKRGWYFRALGEHGQDVWPHGEPRIDQTLTVESMAMRDVIAGGPKEIVVVTKTTSRIRRDPSFREVWVFTVIDGVVWSVNPLDGVDPKTLL
jgi:hypothetical protein